MSYKTLSIKPQSIFTLDIIKSYLRISHDYDDSWVMELLDAAISAAENFMRIRILETHISVKFLPSCRFCSLPLVPVAKIIEVKAHVDDHDIDLHKEEYVMDKEIIKINNLPLYDLLSVEYIAGYIDKNDISASIKQGLILHVVEMYDSRGSICAISSEVQKLYQPYRRILL